MLGELGHIKGRVRRMRFALGCVAAMLVLAPWGRAAAGVWAMIALAAGSVGLYASVAVHYRLAGGDWIAGGILTVFVIGVLLGGSSLVRRPGVAIPGLLGGLIVVLVWLALSGFTFLDQILPDIVHWHRWVDLIVVPFVVGAAGTLWSGTRSSVNASPGSPHHVRPRSVRVHVHRGRRIGGGGPPTRTAASPSGAPSATGSATT